MYNNNKKQKREKRKNLTTEKNLTTIYGGLSNTSINEAKSSFQSKNLAETALSLSDESELSRMHYQHEQSHQNSTVHKTVV